MSDSSDEEWTVEWIPYSQRDEWADVTPIAQDDGEHPVVAIAYSAKCKLFIITLNVPNAMFFCFIVCSP